MLRVQGIPPPVISVFLLKDLINNRSHWGIVLPLAFCLLSVHFNDRDSVRSSNVGSILHILVFLPSEIACCTRQCHNLFFLLIDIYESAYRVLESWTSVKNQWSNWARNPPGVKWFSHWSPWIYANLNHQKIWPTSVQYTVIPFSLSWQRDTDMLDTFQIT